MEAKSGLFASHRDLSSETQVERNMSLDVDTPEMSA